MDRRSGKTETRLKIQRAVETASLSRSLSQRSSADIKPRRIFRAAFQIELKVATFLPFFLSLLSSSLKWYVFNDIVSVCKMPSFHETLFEYSGEILATYSVTAARASFRLSIDPTPIDPGLVCSSRFRLRATPCQYIGSQGSRGISLPESKVTPLIAFL